jgi:pimeloyl-ACP methyl ester carboxylesterase
MSGRDLDPGSRFADIVWRGKPAAIEFDWVGDASSALPPVVFLHEGLGSVAMWKDFPERFCAAYGLSGLVFSRPGYGRSTPKPRDEHWQPDFMQRQADEVLPALLAAVRVERPWLFGHSDGASIALLHAATHDVAGVVAVAPHLFVEEISISSIEKARIAYESGDLRERLSRYHDDPDSAFRGWNDAWLDPAFRGWNIETAIETIRCPVLAVQGEDDEYGTLEQIRAVARIVPHAKTLTLPACGHSPHRDQPDALLRAAGAFIVMSERA